MSKKISPCIAIFTILMTFIYSPKATYGQSEAKLIPNHFVVKFRSDLAPDELRTVISSSETNDSGLVKSFQQFIMLFMQKVTPSQAQEHLQSINEAEKSLQVTRSYRMFDTNDQSVDSTYIYVTDGSVSIDKAVTLFEELPEVAYAQPYYLYETSSSR